MCGGTASLFPHPLYLPRETATQGAQSSLRVLEPTQGNLDTISTNRTPVTGLLQKIPKYYFLKGYSTCVAVPSSYLVLRLNLKHVQTRASYSTAERLGLVAGLRMRPSLHIKGEPCCPKNGSGSVI